MHSYFDLKCHQSNINFTICKAFNTPTRPESRHRDLWSSDNNDDSNWGYLTYQKIPQTPSRKNA